MDLSELNFPEIELEEFVFIHDYQTKLFTQYAEAVKNTEIGKKLVEILSSDPRVQELEGKLISHGIGAGLFEVKALAMWFLWYAKRVGSNNAKEALDLFLNNQKLQVLNCLWVLGVTTDQKVNLCEGIQLFPIDQMVDSRDKEEYLQQQFSISNRGPFPESALICPCIVNKTETPDVIPSLHEKEDFFRTNEKLYDVALLMNLLPGVSCLPFYLTSYVEDSIPMGPFSGSGGGRNIYDVLGSASSPFPRDSTQDFKELYISFSKLGNKEKDRWRRILQRLSQAKRRIQLEDKILDLGISLEMMLLENNKNNDQLSLSFRLRGSWLISNNEAERMENFNLLKNIYNGRSEVAHAGVLKKADVRENFNKYQELAEKIGMHLLIRGKPDWDKLVLGVK